MMMMMAHCGVLSTNWTNTHPLNGPLSGTTQVSQYQKGKTNLDFAGARDSEWQWHQLGRMQVCTSLQTDNHASTPPLSFYRLDALPAAQPTASKHRRIRWHYTTVTTTILRLRIGARLTRYRNCKFRSHYQPAGWHQPVLRTA